MYTLEDLEDNILICEVMVWEERKITRGGLTAFTGNEFIKTAA